MEDLRDVRGRLVHLAIATVIGSAAAIAIWLVLPVRDHFPGMSCFPGPDGRAFSTLLVGAAAIAFGIYVLLRRIRRG